MLLSLVGEQPGIGWLLFVEHVPGIHGKRGLCLPHLRNRDKEKFSSCVPLVDAGQ